MFTRFLFCCCSNSSNSSGCWSWGVRIQLHEQIGLFDAPQNVLDRGTGADAAQNLVGFVVGPCLDELEELGVGLVFGLESVVLALERLALRLG